MCQKEWTLTATYGESQPCCDFHKELIKHAQVPADFEHGFSLHIHLCSMWILKGKPILDFESNLGTFCHQQKMNELFKTGVSNKHLMCILSVLWINFLWGWSKKGFGGM